MRPLKRARICQWPVTGRLRRLATGRCEASPGSLTVRYMNTLDLETGMVFDVWMTNNAIYPYYERLNLTGPAPYNVFSSVFRPPHGAPTSSTS